jgi:hypothetical protein
MSTQRNAERIFEDPSKLIFIQSRAATNEEWVAECMEMMQNGIEFDPVQAIRDESGQIYVWDGLHRGEAAKRLGSLLSVEVRPGTCEKAEWLALSANQKHGLKRTRTDKQKVVRKAFLHAYGAQCSDREIARHCGVDHKTVGKIRREMELSGEIPQIDRRTVTRGTQTYEQNTGQIGGQNTGGDEDKYLPVWELERAISTWPLLCDPANDGQNILADIKDKSPEGRRYFFELQQHLNIVGRYRQRDLRQACHNLLEQLRQQRGADVAVDPSAAKQVAVQSAQHRLPATVPATGEFWVECGVTEESRFWDRDEQERNLCADYRPSGKPAEDTNSNPHGSPPKKHREFECPRCRQEKIVGINGSQRWCLNCGAEWPTAAEFLSEVNAIARMATPARTRLQARFTSLLTKLTDERLLEIDAWLDELESEIPSETEA